MSSTYNTGHDPLDSHFHDRIRPRGMPCLRPWSRSWPLDTTGRMTFLKMPSSVDLSAERKQCGFYGGTAGIAELPPELHWAILTYLPAVDRVCYAITCKRLASFALSSPYLSAAPLTPWPLYTADYFPSRYLLIQRLAHGWVDKKKLRYCWHCQKIMPREATYFWRNLENRKSPRWDFKVDMSKEKWRRMNKKKKYQHLIDTWCGEVREDNSYMSCKPCRNRIWEAQRSELDLEKYARGETDLSTISKLFPVECPLCLEKSLTYIYKPPRKKKVRPFLWKSLRNVLTLIGHTILFILYLFYLLLKVPFDLFTWLWKRYEKRGFRVICLV